MSTITKERIELFIKNPLDNGLTRGEQMELARIALASLEAEPLCYLTWHQGFRAPDDCEEYVVEAKPGDKSCDGTPAFPVYTAPPVPVSVPTFEKWCELTEQKPVGWVRDAMKEAYDACRAAMLHSAEPVSQAYKLNELSGNSPVTPDGWISCSERMPDDGQHVIILCDGAFVLYAQYRDGEFFDIVRNGDEFFETQSRNVTDWMRLPEPPQEVNRG
ncbi:DUF551 domain-containing protein [Escherichia coli]|uniref:DUF551 domain-containing protein n=1 Tax=Escherichia coli TaxID=562 RepID=UPI003D1B35D4